MNTSNTTLSVKSKTKEKGDAMEALVATYLENQGLKVRYRNFRCRQGEIDLICNQKSGLELEWIFVEVRSRRQLDYGDGAASVDYYKQQKIIRTAQFFLHTRPHLAHLPCRFDVVAVTLKADKPEIEWIQNAFTENY